MSVHPHYKFYSAYYSQLEGCTITHTRVKNEDGLLWPVLTITAPDGEVFSIEVSRDEEGNGPGFLFGLPVPSRTEVKS